MALPHSSAPGFDDLGQAGAVIRVVWAKPAKLGLGGAAHSQLHHLHVLLGDDNAGQWATEVGQVDG
jgi:hypothetical protein